MYNYYKSGYNFYKIRQCKLRLSKLLPFLVIPVFLRFPVPDKICFTTKIFTAKMNLLRIYYRIRQLLTLAINGLNWETYEKDYMSS